MLKSLVVIVFVVMSLFAQEYEEEKSYEIGEGFQVGELPLYVGGYFSLDYRFKDSKSRYRIDDLAFLAYGNYEKLSYMAEFEYKEFYTLSETDNEYTSEQDTTLHTERLYLDYTFNENFILRVGKYNSPVGFWNLLPINVLRDTTSSPISTERIFPKFTTGLYGSYTTYSEGELKIDTMLQHNDDFDETYNNYVIDEHYALGITYSLEEMDFKINIGTFDNYLPGNTTRNLHYILASFKYETEEYQVMSEFGSQRSNGSFTTKYAGYLQGVYHLSEQHSTILRLESYDDNFYNLQDEMAILGYVYRPLYPIAIKAEYQFHSISVENQFLFSFSVLF